MRQYSDHIFRDDVQRAAKERIYEMELGDSAYVLKNCKTGDITQIERRSDLEHPEDAFRRGFHQGAYVATQALKSGVSFEKVREWATLSVRKWRYARTRRRSRDFPRDMPPTPYPGGRY